MSPPSTSSAEQDVPKHDVLDFQSSDEAKKRLEVRRKRVLDAFLAAGGEPADGKWTQVAQLCRLSVTRGGRRWLNTNVERGIPARDVQRRPKSRRGAHNHQDFLIQKVESWKQAVTRDSDTPETSASTEARCDVNPSCRARESTVLNFKVTKRCAPSNASKRPSYASGHPSPNARPELSFLPPSFPSHLATSTPQHPARRKPEPIPRMTVSSPCISSEKIQVYDGTMPPYQSQVPKLAAPSSSHTAESKTIAPLPTLTELLVTSKMKARRRRMSQSTHSSSPHSTPRSGNRLNPANDDVLGALHQDVDLDANLLQPRTTASFGFLDVHDSGGIDFDPPFTSTQKPVPTNDHSSPTDRDLWRGYNSQFDIDRRTTDVAKLLERDVMIEY